MDLGVWGGVLTLLTLGLMPASALLCDPGQPWVAPSNPGDGGNRRPWESSFSRVLAVGSWVTQQNLSVSLPTT